MCQGNQRLPVVEADCSRLVLLLEKGVLETLHMGKGCSKRMEWPLVVTLVGSYVVIPPEFINDGDSQIIRMLVSCIFFCPWMK